MEIILYTTHCPQCSVIESKLKEHNLEYTEITDIAKMRELGILSVPVLKVDGETKNFIEANKWLNNLA